MTKDTRVGPSVYTVVDQFVKPMTRAAGNVSWALMKHPEGFLAFSYIMCVCVPLAVQTGLLKGVSQFMFLVSGCSAAKVYCVTCSSLTLGLKASTNLWTKSHSRGRAEQQPLMCASYHTLRTLTSLI